MADRCAAGVIPRSAWLPADDLTEQVSRWSDAKFFVLLADLLFLLVACTGLTGSGPSQPAAACTAAVSVALFVGIWRTSVSVGRDGFIVQGVLHRRRIPWNHVLTVEIVEGPAWLALVMNRPWSADRRSTQRRSSATVLQLKDGSQLRPLILQCSVSCRASDLLTSTALRLAEERSTS